MAWKSRNQYDSHVSNELDVHNLYERLRIHGSTIDHLKDRRSTKLLIIWCVAVRPWGWGVHGEEGSCYCSPLMDTCCKYGSHGDQGSVGNFQMTPSWLSLLELATVRDLDELSFPWRYELMMMWYNHGYQPRCLDKDGWMASLPRGDDQRWTNCELWDPRTLEWERSDMRMKKLIVHANEMILDDDHQMMTSTDDGDAYLWKRSSLRKMKKLQIYGNDDDQFLVIEGDGTKNECLLILSFLMVIRISLWTVMVWWWSSEDADSFHESVPVNQTDCACDDCLLVLMKVLCCWMYALMEITRLSTLCRRLLCEAVVISDKDSSWCMVIPLQVLWLLVIVLLIAEEYRWCDAENDDPELFCVWSWWVIPETMDLHPSNRGPYGMQKKNTDIDAGLSETKILLPLSIPKLKTPLPTSRIH